MIIDSGSSVNIVDRKTFQKIQQKSYKKFNIKTSKAKIYPYASELIKTLGYFKATMESSKRISVQRIYIVDKEDAGNLLGIEAAK